MAKRRAVLITDRPQSVLNPSDACGMTGAVSLLFTTTTWSRASSRPCCRFHHLSELVASPAQSISAAFQLLAPD